VTEDGALRHEPNIRVLREDMLLRLARQVAARHGDPDPELIQHAAGTREAVTRTTGSIVFSDAPSYIVAIKGRFRARRPYPPGRVPATGAEHRSYTVQVLVVDINTGAVTDSGSSLQFPDLTPLGTVVTDYQAAPQ
jgi:hypothetical protein